MPRPDQDSTLRAFVDGESPDELLFDPITDNDSTGSCLGCAYSVVGAAAVAVGLYAASHRGWDEAARFLATAGKSGLALFFVFLSGSLFTLIEFCSSKEIYALVPGAKLLEFRRRRWSKSTVLKSWPIARILRFHLDPVEERDSTANSCLYVVIEHEEPVKLLEACYTRDYVEQIERKLSALCEIPSTTGG